MTNKTLNICSSILALAIQKGKTYFSKDDILNYLQLNSQNIEIYPINQKYIKKIITLLEDMRLISSVLPSKKEKFKYLSLDIGYPQWNKLSTIKYYMLHENYKEDKYLPITEENIRYVLVKHGMYYGKRHDIPIEFHIPKSNINQYSKKIINLYITKEPVFIPFNFVENIATMELFSEDWKVREFILQTIGNMLIEIYKKYNYSLSLIIKLIALHIKVDITIEIYDKIIHLHNVQIQQIIIYDTYLELKLNDEFIKFYNFQQLVCINGYSIDIRDDVIKLKNIIQHHDYFRKELLDNFIDEFLLYS